MRKAFVVVLAIAAMAGVVASCQVGQTMWAACSKAADGNPFGTDGTYVLNCDNGKWKPIMTVGEYLKIAQHKPVTIAPLPTEPTTTTTSTTTTTVAPTLPPAGCYQQSPPTVDGDVSFTGTIGIDDATQYTSLDGTCTTPAVTFTLVLATNKADADAACVANGFASADTSDLAASGWNLPNMWNCI